MKEVLLYILILALGLVMGITNHKIIQKEQRPPNFLLRDYQIEIDHHSMHLWDETRKVGSRSWGETDIDSIILLDNQ
jgi:hypothetical protein